MSLTYTRKVKKENKYTVCPGSSDPPEKILNIFASENEVYTSFNYYNILGWILFVYRAK